MKQLVSILFFIYTAANVSAQTSLTIATDFSAKDLTGKTHHLYDYLDNNSYVLLDFFTTSCGSCQTYASQVSAAFSDFGCNTGNVIVLGLNWGSNNANVHAFDSVYGAFYPAISGLQGGGNRVVDSFQVASYPTVILIAPDRQIVEQYIWPPSQMQLDSIIQSHGGLMKTCNVDIEENNISGKESPITVWPNPAKGVVNIGANTGDDIEISIMYSNGRLQGKYPWDENSGKREYRIKDIYGLSPGLYIVILKKDGIVIGARKLVVS
jgi:thiol-disulfide isomerase/thioredoxin